MTRYVVDTNFFITLYSSEPQKFLEFHEFLKRQKIKLVLSNYIVREMRWYMSRIIVPHCDVIDVDPVLLSKYEKKTARKVGRLPQTPDMSVAYVADQEKLPIVTSDLKLIQVVNKLGITNYMNSAFAIHLMGLSDLTEDVKLLTEYRDVLFADEISYSVKSQNVYDPVIRIKAIMDSALKVVREEQQKVVQKEKKKDSTLHPDAYNYPEYKDLAKTTQEIRKDLDIYLQEMETGNLNRLKEQLIATGHKLMDQSSEVRLLDVPETDPVYKEAIITFAHILLLNSTVAIAEQDLHAAEAAVDQLTIILFEIQEVADRLEIEVHLQRIIIYFLTQQYNRLKIYFTPSFITKCKQKNRGEIITLLRTFGILSAVLTNHQAERNAGVKDFSEIEFAIQLGFQFVAINKPKLAWLLLEQAVYFSINSNMTGLLYAVFEVLLPVHFANQELEPPLSPTIYEIMDEVEKGGVSVTNYRKRLELEKVANPEILIKRSKGVQALPSSLQGFLDVISAETTKFRKLGTVRLVKVIDWQTMNMIGIIDPTLTLDENLTVGTSVQIHSGKVRLIEAPSKLRSKKNINLALVCKADNLKFIIRRSGKISIAQQTQIINEYDLE